jgi:hypothetical protein
MNPLLKVIALLLCATAAGLLPVHLQSLKDAKLLQHREREATGATKHEPGTHAPSVHPRMPTLRHDVAMQSTPGQLMVSDLEAGGSENLRGGGAAAEPLSGPRPRQPQAPHPRGAQPGPSALPKTPHHAAVEPPKMTPGVVALIVIGVAMCAALLAALLVQLLADAGRLHFSEPKALGSFTQQQQERAMQRDGSFLPLYAQ